MLKKENQNMEEKLDIYNSKCEKLNISESKPKVHSEGLWHKVFHCWIMFRNVIDSKHQDYIVLQQRDKSKKSYPNKLDVTAAGHYMEGEGIEGGLRELQEELGIISKEEDLISLGIRMSVDEFEENSLNYEFQDVYFLIDDRPLTTYSLAENEVSGILAAPIHKCIDLFMNKLESFECKGYELNNLGELVEANFIVSKDSFIPTVDNYYLKIFVLAQLALKGEEKLFI